MTKITFGLLLTLITIGATACGSSNNSGGAPGPVVGPAVGPGAVPLVASSPDGNRQLAEYLVNLPPTTMENLRSVIAQATTGEAPEQRAETKRFIQTRLVRVCQTQVDSCVYQERQQER